MVKVMKLSTDSSLPILLMQGREQRILKIFLCGREAACLLTYLFTVAQLVERPAENPGAVLRGFESPVGQDFFYFLSQSQLPV